MRLSLSKKTNKTIRRQRSVMASVVTFIFLLLLSLTTISVFAEVVIEEGYSVTTIIDGNKLGINPHSVLPLYGSSDIIILDSSGSSFYTLSFSKTLESEIKKIAGNGVSGYSDGVSSSATFKHPKSFAIDFNGNVYVADRNNHAIRKVSRSGRVTTIAGGFSQVPGRSDGPARNASFSDDFEVSFIPERCALMISDHGNKLIRQINLKNEDCARGSQSALGMSSGWVAVVVVLSCLISLVVGFVARPYILRHGGRKPLCFSHYTVTQMKEVQVVCSWIRSVCVSLAPLGFVKKFMYLSMSQLSLMFRPKVVVKNTVRRESPSLLDSDHVSYVESMKLPSLVTEQLRGLIPMDGGSMSVKLSSENFEETDEHKTKISGINTIDDIIYANLLGFEEQGTKSGDEKFIGFSSSSSGLVKRK